MREVKELFQMNESPRATCSHVARKAGEKLDEVDTKIRDLERMRTQLTELREACSVGKDAVACCRVMDCFDDNCGPAASQERKCKS